MRRNPTLERPTRVIKGRLYKNDKGPPTTSSSPGSIKWQPLPFYGSSHRLFRQACRLDLEGIVAKWKNGIYRTEQKCSTWIKITNPKYTQAEGSEELFER